jgi:hypothetical protein
MQYVAVENPNPVFTDGSHGQLWLVGQAQLADDDDV